MSGSDYSGTIYEDVALDGLLFDYSSFQNLLTVKTETSASGYTVTYSLGMPVSAKLLWKDLSGAIDRDEGVLKIEPVAGNAFKFTGSKNVHFTGKGAAFLNRVAPILFKRLLDGMAQQMLCCDTSKF
jgi:hypothetical protein